MRRCAFLSMEDTGDFFIYDELLIEPMAQQGWHVDTIPWTSKSTNWSDYDVVIIRSPWDYQDHTKEFMACLNNISNQTTLANDIDIVQWNISKSYLRDVHQQGVSIVPTIFSDRLTPELLTNAYAQFDVDELIIKPLVSANADDTYRIYIDNAEALKPQLAEVFEHKSFMLQPFIKEVISEGEYSLFYFGNDFSHAILKRPKQGDFRVQEEHGGMLSSIQPEPELLALGSQTLATIPGSPLYARLDFIRYQNQWHVMELELIEPSLYFNMDTDSPHRFVNAFVSRFGVGRSAQIS